MSFAPIRQTPRPPNLDSAKLPCLDEPPDEAGLHIQLVGCLLDGEEALLLGFVDHRAILCAA